MKGFLCSMPLRYPSVLARPMAGLYGRVFPSGLGRQNVRQMSIDGAETEEDAHEIMFYAQRNPATVTLREMYEYGASTNHSKRTMLLAAQFLHEELPVRLARRARELKKLPFGLNDMVSIKGVRKLYERSFFRIRRFPKPISPELEERFTEMLEDIKNEHNNVQANIARGLQELSENRQDIQRQRGTLIHAGMPFDFGQFLDRFYLSRVGVRVLIGQHIMLHHPQEGFIGIIQKECKPAEVCRHALEDAERICEMSYGNAPPVVLEGATELSLPYVPEHLHYIFFELLKNSMRAVVERNRQEDNPGDMQPVSVVFAEGSEDITIKISDKGGGIPRSGMDRLWTYTFTTAGNTAEKLQQMNAPGRPIMAGFAHGLPLSRIHARAFGGDLNVMSMHGNGTDVYIHISKLGDREVAVP